MNKYHAKKYPKWRRRCLECKHLGLNTPEGILCKKDQREGSKCDLVFYPANQAKGVRCKEFEQWVNPLSEEKYREDIK